MKGTEAEYVTCCFWQAFTKELLIWSSLKDHPGIAKFIGYYADFKRLEAWLLAPWEPHGNITDFISRRRLEVPEKLSLVGISHWIIYPPLCIFHF